MQASTVFNLIILIGKEDEMGWDCCTHEDYARKLTVATVSKKYKYTNNICINSMDGSVVAAAGRVRGQ
jgi:hypothetical protein